MKRPIVLLETLSIVSLPALGRKAGDTQEVQRFTSGRTLWGTEGIG
jgi:hypothetical protein